MVTMFDRLFEAARIVEAAGSGRTGGVFTEGQLLHLFSHSLMDQFLLVIVVVGKQKKMMMKKKLEQTTIVKQRRKKQVNLKKKQLENSKRVAG